MQKAFKITEIALILLSVVFLVAFYLQNSKGAFDLSNMAAIMASTNILDGLLGYAYLLCGIAVVALFLLTLRGLLKNPKALKQAGINLLLAVIVVVLSYVCASGTVVPVNIDPAPDASVFKMTDFFLIMCYILFAASLVLLIFGSPLSKLYIKAKTKK